MADKIVQVPGVGNVSFPDSMSDDDISSVIAQQHPELQAQAQQPNSVMGGIGRRLWDTAKSAVQTLSPIPTQQELQDAAANPTDFGAGFMGSPEGLLASRLGRGFTGSEKQAGRQAAQQFQQAGAIKGDPAAKVLKYAQSGVTAASMLDPFATGSVANVNELQGQGRAREAAGQGLTDAAMLGTSLAAPAIADLLPSKARAGALFNEASAAAGKTPIDVSAPGNSALQIRDMAASGGRMPKVIRDFISRTTDPNQGPLTYDEAREFLKNAGELSVNERNALNPSMQRMVGQFRAQLGQSIQDAANQAGVGPQYQGAMSQYRGAMKMQNFVDMLKQATVQAGAGALKGTAYGAGLAGPGYLLYKILRGGK